MANLQTPAGGNPSQVPSGSGGVTSQQGPPPKILTFKQASKKVPRPEYNATVNGIALGGSYQKQVEANGFLSDLKLRITVSGGVGSTTAGVLAADAPWNIINSVNFFAPGGGSPLLTLTGYDLYLATTFGGYRYGNPADFPTYVGADSGGNFQFTLVIPVEIIRRSGIGLLENLNSGSLFSVQINFAGASTVYSTEPGTVGTIGVMVFSNNYTQPEPKSTTGLAQETIPPLFGTTQYWTQQASSALTGTASYTSMRVGNVIRNLILKTTQAGVRVDALPDPFRVTLNNKEWQVWTPETIKDHNYEVFKDVAPVPTGVYIIPLTTDFDGHPGDEIRSQWLPTTTATKLQFEGNWGSTATVLEVVTNDIAVVGDYLNRWVG
jgi:hypothetical protein